MTIVIGELKNCLEFLDDMYLDCSESNTSSLTAENCLSGSYMCIATDINPDSWTKLKCLNISKVIILDATGIVALAKKENSDILICGLGY